MTPDQSILTTILRPPLSDVKFIGLRAVQRNICNPRTDCAIGKTSCIVIADHNLLKI